MKMVKAYLVDEGDDWDLFLGCLAGAYRATPNQSIGVSPNILTMGREHINERYRMVYHVQKHHYALSEAPFYCSMCLYRCSTREALVKLVTDYRRHALMSAMQ
ncbi:hypothetical protein DPMN_165968 [Dreissena polymorpha]|uniref:Uncharacterized protein n=1 Tax=Dreissena polymorpha TaxID=45954 RepID=A0A9D4EVY9_DREPO|nr:hypothetical protein DPMN_165968 [Dreissena polymorpha]